MGDLRAPGPGVLRVVAAPHPFSTVRADIAVPEGRTVAEILEAVQPDPVLRRHAHVFIGDRPVPRDWWHRARPKAGHTITVRVVPQGGGGGKNPLRTILTIAVIAASFLIGPELTALIGPHIIEAGLAAGLSFGTGAALASAVSAGIVLGGGMLLVNAIAPVRPPSLGALSGSDRRDSPTLFIEGARNAARPFGTIPAVLGRHRQVPPLGAATFTEIVGEDHYLRRLVVWGYGPLEIEDIRIGETPLASFEGVQIETRQGYEDDAALTLFPDSVAQQDFSILLTQASGWHSRTAGAGADELSVDITLPQGLARFMDDGSRQARSVIFEIAYRAVGDSDWLAPTFSATTARPGWVAVNATETRVTVTQNRTSAIRHGFRWTVDRGQYDIRIRRITGDQSSSQIFDEIVWTALRTIADEDPIAFGQPLAKTALVIKATDQLNRAIDELNATVTSIVPDWDGSAWTEAATANPASLFRHVLQGPANARPLADSRIDLDALEDWHDDCAAQGFTFNMIRDFRASVWDTLADIATAGRASPGQRDGKWSVVVDRAQDAPVQHFTPRNSWGFEAEKAFPDMPHAFRVRFANETEGWRQDERIVYDDGYSAATAEKFEELEAIGQTDPDQVWKFARFQIAQGRLRPERWTFNADFEHIVARRGDLVLITHDVLLVGLASARIKALETDTAGDVTGMTVDEALPMEAGTDYGVSIRTVGERGLTRQIVTEDGERRSVTFSTAIPAAAAPAIGDLLGFGELGAETVEALILGIEPQSELTARLTAIPYASAVYQADTGTIPVFVSGLTPLPAIPAPAVLRVRSDESVLALGSGNTLIPHIGIELTPPATAGLRLEARIRAAGTGEPFAPADLVEWSNGHALLGGVEERREYDIRLRWTLEGRLPGPWATISGHRVVGQTSPPATLQGLTVSVFGGSALLRWTSPADLDVRFGGTVHFRHSPETDPADASWQESTSIGDTAKSADLIAQLPLKPGTYLARVYDKGGRPSTEVAKVATKQASVLAFASAAADVVEDPAFAGTKDMVTASDGVLFLAAAGLFDDIADFDEIESLDTFSGIESEGTYDFAAGFDFGSVKRVRLTADLAATSVNTLDLIDGRVALIDSWESFDGNDQAEGDCQVWVSTTDDDPDATDPDWSDWQRLDAAEFEARGARFQARLSTRDIAFNINVDRLRIHAEELA